MDTQGGQPGALVGVEEEFLVVDPVTRAVSPRAGELVTAAAAVLGSQVCAEITKYQIEVKTTPCGSIPQLRDELVRLRESVAAVASGLGLTLAPSGTPVLGPAAPPPITEGARYELGIASYRSLHDESHVCAVHVHVQVADPTLAVLTGNHLRPWLPVLTAALANSPYWLGRDTGYASWRTLTWGKWPVAGPPPYFGSGAEFDSLTGALARTGALVDPGTIFWDIRPSSHLPTLEFRACDVPSTVEESVLLAALVRALVTTAAAHVAKGDMGPPVPGALLRAACWRAARDGLAGQGADPRTGKLSDAGTLLTGLVEHTQDALKQRGELDEVADGVARLLAGGCGADRQRAAYGRRGSLADVVDHLTAELTRAGR